MRPEEGAMLPGIEVSMHDRCGEAGSVETELSTRLKALPASAFWFGHLGSSDRNYRWGLAGVVASMARNSNIKMHILPTK